MNGTRISLFPSHLPNNGFEQKRLLRLREVSYVNFKELQSSAQCGPRPQPLELTWTPPLERRAEESPAACSTYSRPTRCFHFKKHYCDQFDAKEHL
ncbi:unnamed protein product [Caretta caretta]